MDSDDPLGRTFDLIKELLEEAGAETGAIFYHPYRGQDGDDRGFWKDLLPKGDPRNFETIKDQLSFEPHFHAIVLSKFIPTEHFAATLEEKTGWVFHRITKTEDSDVSIFDKFDLARATSYCLSHTAIETGERRSAAAYRYFGQVANFAAKDHIEREMDAAARSVAPKVLGLRYDSLSCRIEREKTELTTIEVAAEKVDVGQGIGYVGEPPTEEIELEEIVEQACEGRLLDINKAPRYLEDEEWMHEADHADDLQKTWLEWEEQIG